MAGASAADVLTITGTPTTAGSLQKARITGQFVKNPTDGVTGSHPTNQWWFINPEDIHALSATYFSQVELKDIQLETYPGGEAKGWTRMSGIETVSLDNVNLSISGTEENSKSFIWANSLTTSGQENTIYVGGLGPESENSNLINTRRSLTEALLLVAKRISFRLLPTGAQST